MGTAKESKEGALTQSGPPGDKRFPQTMRPQKRSHGRLVERRGDLLAACPRGLGWLVERSRRPARGNAVLVGSPRHPARTTEGRVVVSHGISSSCRAQSCGPSPLLVCCGRRRFRPQRAPLAAPLSRPVLGGTRSVAHGATAVLQVDSLGSHIGSIFDCCADAPESVEV